MATDTLSFPRSSDKVNRFVGGAWGVGVVVTWCYRVGFLGLVCEAPGTGDTPPPPPRPRGGPLPLAPATRPSQPGASKRAFTS